jgi:hypothetical protein
VRRTTAWRAGAAETVLPMSRLRTWFAPPRNGDARETLRWVRRMEIGAGVLGLIAAATTWSGEWWSWLIVGGSLLSLSPWPGAAAILRSARSRPEVLITDSEHCNMRGRRFLRYFLPIYILVFAAIGYLLLGPGGTIFFFAGSAVGGGHP